VAILSPHFVGWSHLSNIVVKACITGKVIYLCSIYLTILNMADGLCL